MLLRRFKIGFTDTFFISTFTRQGRESYKALSSVLQILCLSMLDPGDAQRSMEVYEFSVEPDHLTRVKLYDHFSFPYAFPGNVKDHLKKIAATRIRDTDVLLSTYPKSGKLIYLCNPPPHPSQVNFLTCTPYGVK